MPEDQKRAERRAAVIKWAAHLESATGYMEYCEAKLSVAALAFMRTSSKSQTSKLLRDLAKSIEKGGG